MMVLIVIKKRFTTQRIRKNRIFVTESLLLKVSFCNTIVVEKYPLSLCLGRCYIMLQHSGCGERSLGKQCFVVCKFFAAD